MSESSEASRVHAKVDSPLGELTLVREGERIAGLYFEHHWYRPPPSSFGRLCDDGFDLVTSQLKEYFAGRRQAFDLPALLVGPSEQVAVWRLVSRIPYGKTTTYGTLARELGLEIPAREVGRLIGRNPLCILIPCHRVIGASGDLTGYAGGVARKRALLELEGALPVRSHQLMFSFDEIAATAGSSWIPGTG
jgi:methylated-DNA-[protein]-cysteine S-methyltransferase